MNILLLECQIEEACMNHVTSMHGITTSKIHMHKNVLCIIVSCYDAV